MDAREAAAAAGVAASAEAAEAAEAQRARGVAVPLAMASGGEQLLACPGACGQSFSASRLVFHLRSHGCAAAVGGPDMAAQATAAIAAAANALPPAAGSGPLLCPAEGCRHASPTLKALRKHYAACHGAAQHACGRCGARFGRSDALSRHAKVCSRPAAFACVCSPGCTFSNLYNLNRHIRARAAKSPAERHERLRRAGEEAQGPPRAGAAPPPEDALPEAMPLLQGAEFNLLEL